MAALDAPVLVDEDAENDSGFEDDDQQSQTTSLKSAVTKYIYENGRRYHSYRSGAYWGPNDEEAQDNLDLFHHIFSLTLDGKLFLAPIGTNPHRVLDIGTGTGIWAIDFADHFPSAAVVATDLSPIQPVLVPPNLEFQIDDFCEPWTFRKESFDFIHARCIYGCVVDFPALYAQAYEHLRPGGWFENTEISVHTVAQDDSIKGTSLEKWSGYVLQSAAKSHKSFAICEESEGFMRGAGFQNVTYIRFTWPIGSWPKDKKMKQIGAYNRLAWEEGLEGWAMFLFTNFLGWKRDEILVLCADIRKNLRDKSLHAYQEISVCYGQKPMAKANAQEDDHQPEKAPRHEG